MMNTNMLAIASELTAMLEEANVPYEFTEAASLQLQGVEMSGAFPITVNVQWDLFEKVYDLLQQYAPSPIERTAVQASFKFSQDSIDVHIYCYFNTTIRTNPYRTMVQKGENSFWCCSLYAYLYFPEDERYAAQIRAALLKEQQELTAQNEQAWNQNNYTALINRYGEPAEIAKKIKQNPEWRLHPFYKYVKDAAGKKVMHLMGSNGVKAVALSLLGADVTVADFSHENAMFANELAKEADVAVSYIISDVLSLSEKVTHEQYDIVLMELGVLHYFIDLQPLFRIVKRLLRPGGRFILHEFHPISTKLITSTGKKHKVTGNYFNPSIERGEVAFSKHMPEKESLAKVVQRKWTIGELVTSIVQEGLVIQVLEEEPNHKMHDIGLPKTFTIVAEKK
ncbi:class I SAM-dependent methyltransferase [Ectobacillus panaciterrae]|uniref:class I SAM-dependent methyltransferase n=1 Tax=Ectobacillus panaciterrae TaxID=363872 RepID=UPI000402EACA|nr:class I SAM-dependent methyltransferase [Ectobacillus panaciterrae]